jgi:hypothetical protein
LPRRIDVPSSRLVGRPRALCAPCHVRSRAADPEFSPRPRNVVGICLEVWAFAPRASARGALNSLKDLPRRIDVPSSRLVGRPRALCAPCHVRSRAADPEFSPRPRNVVGICLEVWAFARPDRPTSLRDVNKWGGRSRVPRRLLRHVRLPLLLCRLPLLLCRLPLLLCRLPFPRFLYCQSA